MKSLVEESIIEEVEKEYITEGKSEEEPEAQSEEPIIPMEPEVATPPKEVAEEEDEVLILKEGKKEVVVMEIDVEDEPSSTENTVKNDEKEKNELNSVVENISLSTTDPTSPTDRVVDPSIDSQAHVVEPISSTCGENSLPGISDEIEMTEPGAKPGDIFSIALSTRETPLGMNSPNRSTAATNGTNFFDDLPSYALLPMKFDFPRIKVEPVDPDVPPATPTVGGDDGDPEIQVTGSLIDIDLTADDTSMDEVDSGMTRTEIDGNSAVERMYFPFLLGIY